MIAAILQQVLGHWPRVYPHLQTPETLDFIFQSRNHIVVHWFLKGKRFSFPILFSKIARDKIQSSKLERAIGLTNQLIDRLAAPFVNTIPKRWVAGKINGLLHILIEPVPGRTMIIPPATEWGNKTVLIHTRAFYDWLLELQRQTAMGTKTCNQSDWESFFSQSLDPEFYEMTILNRNLRLMIATLCTRLAGLTLPLAIGYGDAHHSNLLMTGQKISGVVDWVGIMQEQWVFIDWFYFLFMYAIEHYKKNLSLDPEEQVQFAINAIMGNNRDGFSGIINRQTDRFLEHYQVPIHLKPQLAFVFLAKLHWTKDKSNLMNYAAQKYLSLSIS